MYHSLRGGAGRHPCRSARGTPRARPGRGGPPSPVDVEEDGRHRDDGVHPAGRVESRDGSAAGPGHEGGGTLGGMRRVLEHCELRPFTAEDAPSLARHANDVTVWRNLRDAFPHPYTLEHAVSFIAHIRRAPPGCHLAIVVDGQAVGSIGLKLGADVERVSAELGYWLGAPYPGPRRHDRGASAPSPTTRSTASRSPASSPCRSPSTRASCRALEKAGFTLEATLRRSAVKDGQIIDQRLYARGREPERPGPAELYATSRDARSVACPAGRGGGASPPPRRSIGG